MAVWRSKHKWCSPPAVEPDRRAKGQGKSAEAKGASRLRQLATLQARLHDAESELAAIYENAPLLMMLIDEDYRVHKANRFASAAASTPAVPGTSLGAIVRCVEALPNPEGCGFGTRCAGCGLRTSVRDTLQKGQPHTLVETTVPLEPGGPGPTATLLLSTSRLVLRDKPHVLLTLLDITEHKKVEASLTQAQRLARLGGWEWDIEHNRHTWSEEIYRIYGRDPALPAAGYPQVKRYFTPPSWTNLAAAVKKALSDGLPYECDAEVVRPDGTHRWITAQGQAVLRADGRVLRLHGTVQDITDRKQAEQRITKLLRAQAILAGVDHAIVRLQDRQQLLDEICRVAVEQGSFKLVWIGMVSPDGSVQPVARAGQTQYLKGIRVVVRDEPDGRGPVGTAIRENRPVIIENVDNDSRMMPWRARAQRFGLCYVAAFPIQIAHRVRGSIQFYAPSTGFFDPSEIRLLRQVSEDIAFALAALETIAERNQAERQLRQSEQELADFFAASPLGLVWVGPEGRIVRVNRAQLELLDRGSKEVLGRPVSEFHVDPEIALDLLARVADREIIQNYRARLRQKDGSIKHVLIDANGFWDQEKLLHSRWFVRDITHRVELEREILNISEREQRRLGHDLHDDLCQQLAGIEFLSQSLARELANKAALEADHAGEIAKLVQQAMGHTRELAHGLSPVGMDAEGLSTGLGQLAERISKIFRLDCRFTCRKPVLVPDHAVSIHLYRIAQEAVHNAVKHGKASRIEILLTATPDKVNLGVSDNGIGLPRRRTRPQGMGLRIMRYRAGVIGGSLLVQRLNNGGTAVICSVTKGLLPPGARNTT